MYKRPLRVLLRFLQKIYYWILIRSFPLYQPVYRGGKLDKTGDRACLDRWQTIKKEIIAFKAQSVLDLGCAEGFYVLAAAKEMNCVALGVDSNTQRIMVAQNQLTLEKINSAGYLTAVVDGKLLDKMPRFDLVIFMSVLHHIMYSQGENYCRKILQKLRPKIGSAMIFEMGQSNEHRQNWSQKLPNMGGDPHGWIRQFLLSCGFSSVTKIGESDSHKGEQKRAIFRAEP